MKKLLFSTFLTALAFSTPSKAEDFSKAQIEQIIKEYIQKNPEVILDSVEDYSRQQQEASVADRQKAVDENLDWILNNKKLPVAGNPNGDVTIVEFYDYNCGYCKKAVSDITTVLEEDKDVKIIFMEMPILGRTSEIAARWAMAAEDQGRFLEYHIGLMQNRGPISEDVLEKIAKDVGLDVVKMRKVAEAPETSRIVAEKSAKASAMGINGTPAFIIDGRLYGGYIGLDAMRRAIKEAREG